MHLAKIIRLDASDTKVFERPAEIGEWAITGTFSFVDVNPTTWSNKYRFAFQTAWLGIGSFGHSTLVQTTELSDSEYEILLQTLAGYLVAEYSAPSHNAAVDAAKQEIDDMASLCNHPIGTLLAIERSINGEDIAERTRIINLSNGIRKNQFWTVSKD